MKVLLYNLVLFSICFLKAEPIVYQTFEEEEGFSPVVDFSAVPTWFSQDFVMNSIGIGEGAFEEGGQHGFIGGFEQELTSISMPTQATASTFLGNLSEGTVEIGIDLVFSLPEGYTGYTYTIAFQTLSGEQLFGLTFTTGSLQIFSLVGATQVLLPNSFLGDSESHLSFTIDFDNQRGSAQLDDDSLVEDASFPEVMDPRTILSLLWVDLFQGSDPPMVVPPTESYLAFDNLYVRERPSEGSVLTPTIVPPLTALGEVSERPVFFLEAPIGAVQNLEASEDLDGFEVLETVTFTEGFRRFQPTGDELFFRLAEIIEGE